MEGYVNDPTRKNEAGVSMTDFVDKMVLRFQNENELSLYFDCVD